jgi:hypothetical protein
LVLVSAAGVAGPAAGTVPPPTSISPAPGARFDDGGGFPKFSLTTAHQDPAPEYVVRISREPTTGPDGLLTGGQTLAFTRDPASPDGSDVFLTQYSSPSTGVHYWQVQARDPDPPGGSVALSPINTLTVFQSLEMFPVDAAYQTKRVLRVATHPPPKGIVINTCVRRSVSRFNCRVGWSTRVKRWALGAWLHLAYRRRGYGSVLTVRASNGARFGRKCVLDVVRTGRTFDYGDCPLKRWHLSETLTR